MVRFLFLDLDDTILDFHKAEQLALSKTLEHFGVAVTQARLDRYHQINKAHWERLEKGELTRPEVLVGRFAQFFREQGVRVEPARCAKVYEKHLSCGHFFLPGAMEAVRSLYEKYPLYLASNGTAVVQQGRLESAGLYPWFQEVFISQELGANKPAKAFFDACFAKIPDFDKEKAVMVGDSLSSDILGGRNAGLRTVWINPSHKDGGDIRPDYEIENITQLEALLEQL